jgi:alpha-L-fucosidase
MRKTLCLLLMVISSLLPRLGRCEVPPAAAGEETSEQRDARMRWWRDARFGMFIHWGLYAIPAGEWNGRPVPDLGEWIMNNADIAVADYEALASQFNPVKYDPAAWVRAAKDAGMKYVVITSKHHDGFCLFDTQATDWDVVDSTPYRQDLLVPLARECRKQGLHFGVYYSIMDWHHPSQTRGEKAYNPTQIVPSRKQEYVQYVRSQLKGLLDLCDPEILWFDGEWPKWWTEQDGRELYAYLRELKPRLVINNRIAKRRRNMLTAEENAPDWNYIGDFGTPEQQIPATGTPGVDWETCMTINRTWGFKKDDHDWKSPETLIRHVVDIASKGGNFLLNVGPTAEGEIPAASIDRLEAIGRWMRANGESIYGTTASPFPALSWGRCTKRVGEDGTTLYLHVFDWPEDGRLRVPSLRSSVSQSRLLAAGETLALEREGDDVLVTVPEGPSDPVDTVIVLEVDGPLDISPGRPVEEPKR